MTEGVERRLMAILDADVVGYSRLMGEDEAGTHARLKALRREVIEPGIAGHRGRIVKLTGDGALVEFPSVVEAVLCAVDVQRAVADHNGAVPEKERLEFRIGVNLGDVISDENDIYGDGVNVAARLQTLAEPGGVCVSRTVYHHVKDKVDLAFEPMGEHRVKNIAERISVYRVLLRPDAERKTRHATIAPQVPGGRPAIIAAAALVILGGGVTGAWYSFWRSAAEPLLIAAPQEERALPLPDRPSIAVLPFDNLSGEERWERLADGLTEDIITDLSRFRDLFVIARNSTAVYKGQPTDVREIARELGVHYVLEGSLQTDGDRVRITAQLIDGGSGNHLWSERYDHLLDDVFAVQDEVTQQVAGTLGGYRGRLAQAGREGARRKPDSLQAYDYYLLAADHKHLLTEEGNETARELLNRAIEFDPQLARAYIALAWTHEIDLFLGFSDDPGRSLSDLEAAARMAVRLDDGDAEAHLVRGVAHLYQGEIERGAAAFERALQRGENNADVLAIASWTGPARFGATQQDVERVKRAMRLNPHYPDWYLHALGYAAYHAGYYEEVVGALRRASNQTLETKVYLALSSAELGRAADTTRKVSEIFELEAEFSAEWFASANAFLEPAVIEHFLGSARKAGLPLCASEAQLANYPEMERLPECEAERARS